jgi:predicted DNA binding CopG/RHH family protein
MEKNVRAKKLPNTDSVQELAKFRDTHDLTDFAQALKEVGEPVFARSKYAPLSVDLPPQELQRVRRLAKSKGVNETTMVREWILERLHQSV